MRILSTLGVNGVLDELGPRLEAELGDRLDISYNPTAVLAKEIEAGARGDVALLTSTAIDRFIAAGILKPGSRVDLARSKVGIAVRAGAVRPDISTADAVRDTLLAAPSIAYSRAGASGIFFAGLIERLGIAEAVNAKATVIPAGFTGELVADGRCAIAVQQVSELMVVPGIDIVGPLPPEAQDDLVFSGGIFAAAADADRAGRFLKLISGSATDALYARKGLYPVG